MLAIAEPEENDTYKTTQFLAERWSLDATTLANLRHRGEGIPYVKLPSGAVRYRMRDILAAERGGLVHYFTWNDVVTVLEKYPGMTDDEARVVANHLRRELPQVVAQKPTSVRLGSS
jgi:hypothetical protein